MIKIAHAPHENRTPLYKFLDPLLESGQRCKVVPSTEEPFCNITCEVANGRCGDDLCLELVACIDPDQPYFNAVICSIREPPTVPGMTEVKCALPTLRPLLNTHPLVNTHMHANTYTSNVTTNTTEC